MMKAQMGSTHLVEHMLTFMSRYVFTLSLNSIYVETYYLQTNTSIKVNIRQTQSDTDWLPTYKLQLTYGII
jgi:hypothetical protein